MIYGKNKVGRCFFVGIVALGISACSAEEPPMRAGMREVAGQCFSSPAILDSISNETEETTNGRSEKSSNCLALHHRALALARREMSNEDAVGAKEALHAFRSDVQEVESQRLFLLYAIAKIEANRPEMVRIYDQVNELNADDPYAQLVRGVEMCLRDNCAAAVPNLEDANAEIDVLMARGYLAAAYAYSGRWGDAEVIIDQIAPKIAEFDLVVFYIGVATYVQQGRREDARDIADVFFSANKDIDDSPMLRDAKRILNE